MAIKISKKLISHKILINLPEMRRETNSNNQSDDSYCKDTSHLICLL